MHLRKKFNLHANKSRVTAGNLNLWIKNKKSLTNRIKDIASLKIKLITNKRNIFLLSEKQFFSSYRPETLFLREVIIFANDDPIMYARTVLPYKYLRSHWAEIKNLKTNSLSEVVYDKPCIKRSNFSYLPSSLNNNIIKKIHLYGLETKKLEIGRQSHFKYKKENILLTEFFFAALDKFDFQ